MGCDIHVTTEKKINGTWTQLSFEPFTWRSYGMFGFLAGVRNYSAIPSLAKPRGFPPDATAKMDHNKHSHSWLSVKELLDFNYEAEMEDRRVVIDNNHGSTCEPGGGEKMTYREFLGRHFFKDLEVLKELGATRIVFSFDS